MAGDSGSAGDAGSAGLEPSGSALSFTGKELQLFPRASLDDLTIEMWIRTTTVGDTGSFYRGAALFYADASGDQNDFGATLIENSFAFGIGNPDTTALSQTAVNTGAWFHVAGIRERGSGIVRVLVNGNVESTLVSTNRNALDMADIPSMGGHLLGGMFYDPFVGVVDEVRLWNVARTPDQIRQAFRARLNGDESGLVGYWHFDEGQGGTAHDSSSSHADLLVDGGGDPARVPQWITPGP